MTFYPTRLSLKGLPARAQVRATLTAVMFALVCLIGVPGAVAQATAPPDAAPPAAATPTLPMTSAPAEPTAPIAPPGTRPVPHSGSAIPERATLPAMLPHDLSPWGMFMAADIVVKSVMVGLAFASVATWTVWLAKSLELLAATRENRRAFARVAAARSLPEAADRLLSSRSVVARFVAAATAETDLSAGLGPEGLRERVASRLERLEAAAGRRVTRGTGLLATIGATAPFVGLFGTVWGIMNAFIGISRSQTTNLAVVAPGIAEALLATAIGLVAAIPAVVIYNLFARWITGYRVLLADAAAEIQRHVSRDLDRAQRPQVEAGG